MMAQRTDEALKGSRGSRSGRLLRVFLFAASLIGALFAPDAHAGVRNDIDSILSERGYQRTMPPPPRQIHLKVQFPEASLWDAGPAIRVLLWVLVGAGVLFLAYQLYIFLSRMERRSGDERQQSRKTGIAGTAQTEDEEPTLASLDEIERLAQDGAYAEAVHLILLHCIDYLRERFPFARDPALTSREILAHGVLPDGVRNSFGFIVAAVEVAHFGRRHVEKSVYERCLNGYRAIAAANAS